MKFLGNLIWLICGGFVSAVGWFLEGLLWTITIIGIPWGRQCFKLAKLSLAPFGKDVTPGGGAVSCLANFVWLLISGIPLALHHYLCGILLCITIIGIPFGKQHFKLGQLALFPFGAKVR